MTSRVHHKFAGSPERGETNLTEMRFLAGVMPLVDRQVSGLRELFAADLAAVRTLAGVLASVDGQVARRAEPLAAEQTFVRTFTCHNEATTDGKFCSKASTSQACCHMPPGSEPC